MITIRRINEENIVLAGALTLKPGQERFVQSAPEILAGVEELANCRPVCFGIYAEEQMVGIAMIHDLEEEPACYHLARLMIDGPEQGKGYGTYAVELLLEHCKREGKFGTVELCVHKEALSAIHVYEKAGFRDTGYTDPDAPRCIIMSIPLSQVPMVIRYRDIILRDMRESDIGDMIRFMTVDTEWGDWDAPWETLDDFDPEAYRLSCLKCLEKPLTGHRWSFQIETAGGDHIGKVSSYLLDERFEWLDDAAPGQKVYYTLGLSILDSSRWGRGLGTQALAAWVKYHLDEGIRDICLQTWSGNIRMVRSAQRLGFVECRRLTGIRQVRGGSYDALTFQLDEDRFAGYLAQNP